MSKTNADKKVNRQIKAINRQIQSDGEVFGPRFSVRLVSKHGYIDAHDLHWYQFEFCDADQPQRNYIEMLDQFEVLISNKLWIAMNNFIVHSNFWSDIWPQKRDAFFKEKDMCFSCEEYVPFTIRKERLTRYSVPEYQPYEFIGEQAYCKKCKMPIWVETIEKRNLEKIQETHLEITQISRWNICTMRLNA